MFERIRDAIVILLGIILCLFTLAEVNYPRLQPQSALAVFVMLGLVLCFLVYPIHPRLKDNKPLRILDVLFAAATVVCCGYIVIQNEQAFESFWARGMRLSERVRLETTTDFAIGLIGLLLVFEATRRTIGLIVPVLALSFVFHSYYCHLSIQHDLPEMPDWLLPHRGQDAVGLVRTTFLQTLGVFGPAANVMFKYVFLFVVFGSFLEMSGATQFIIDFAERVFAPTNPLLRFVPRPFRGLLTDGGPAKVSVLGSGLMGSLSGSAVANAVTTGAFTIPMMRNSGFRPHVAGGITAAAAAGGALVPPVMGAGAYMMLEIIEPPVTFLEVAKAALIPAALYYFSIFMIVHFYSQRIGTIEVDASKAAERGSLLQFEAFVFFGALAALVGLLLMRFSPFRAVTGSLMVILLFTTVRKKLNLGLYPRVLAIASFVVATVIHQLAFATTVDDPSARQVFDSWLGSSIVGMFALLIFGLVHPVWRPAMMNAMTKSAKNGISLVAASACVGILIGVVQQTGIATDFSSVIKSIVETNLLLALIGIMVCSIILGMGVPSVVCYLLMATLMGSLLSELDVIPLAAHLFIFYFGMMSMVTPPVALAAYASASIAGSNIMPTALAAFRFSLVGFTLPFMFIYRPELLLMTQDPAGLSVVAVILAVTAASFGIVALAAGIAGYLRGPLEIPLRVAALIAAGLLLFPDKGISVGDVNLSVSDLVGLALFVAILLLNRDGQTESNLEPQASE